MSKKIQQDCYLKQLNNLQLPPIESLGVEYITAPLYGRGSNTVSGLHGDTFRIVAPFDNTEITINGVLRSRLKSQQYFEFNSIDPQRIQSSQPVLLLQFSNGQTFDGADTSKPINGSITDPFMIVVPPAEQYISKYTVNTPARSIERNFINVLMPTQAIATALMDDAPFATDSFSAIPDSRYSYAQIEVAMGTHNLEAVEPFGVYLYGYDSFESYGYLGGMAFSLPDTVASLIVDAVTSLPVGEQLCLSASVSNVDKKPVNGVRVQFNVKGTRTTAGYALSNRYGIAQYCYATYQTGTDIISMQVGSQTAIHTAIWVSPMGNVAPIINSLPGLTVVSGGDFAAFNYKIVIK